MEPYVQQVLLWLYKEDLWLCIIIDSPEGNSFFDGDGISSNFMEKFHQFQLIKSCVHYIFVKYFRYMFKILKCVSNSFLSVQRQPLNLESLY